VVKNYVALFLDPLLKILGTCLVILKTNDLIFQLWLGMRQSYQMYSHSHSASTHTFVLKIALHFCLDCREGLKSSYWTGILQPLAPSGSLNVLTLLYISSRHRNWVSFKRLSQCGSLKRKSYFY